MATGVVTWSQTAASNATADGNVNWAEGMAASQVNDSARAVMASVAKYRDDLAAGNSVGGSGTAMTLTSNQGFASLAAMHGAELAFVVGNFSNGTNATLAVDSLAAKPFVLDLNGTVLPPGVMTPFSMWTVFYSNNVPGFVVKGVSTNTIVPVGTIWQYGASSAPTGWLLCDGTGYSQTTQANLFAIIGTTYGSTGAGMFSVPDLRARVPVGYDAGSASGRMAGLHSGNISGAASSLGNTGGEENHALTTAELPTFTPSGTIGGTQTLTNVDQGSNAAAQPLGGGNNIPATVSNLTINGSNFTFTGNAIGSGSSHNTIQPSIVVNYIIKT